MSPNTIFGEWELFGVKSDQSNAHSLISNVIFTIFPCVL